MNPIGPQTNAAPRFETPVARVVEARAPAGEAQRPDPNLEASLAQLDRPSHPPIKASENVSAQVTEEVKAIRESVQQAVDRLNEQMRKSQRALGFQVDQANDSVVVRVTNKETGEVVREIPLEAAVRLGDPFETLKGMLFDETL